MIYSKKQPFVRTKKNKLTPVLNSISVDVGDSNTVTISAAQNSDNLYALNNIDDVFTFNYQPEIY